MLVELAEKRDDQLLEKYSKVLFDESSSIMSWGGPYQNRNFQPPGTISGIFQLLGRALSGEMNRFRITFYRRAAITYEDPSVIISANVLRSSSLPLPNSFLEQLQLLPVDVLGNILSHLDGATFLSMRLACYDFHVSISEIRFYNRIMTLQRREMTIMENGFIRIYRDNATRDIGHNEFLRSARVMRFNHLVIEHRGDFRAEDCHIPQLHVRKLELRFRDTIPAAQAPELETLFHQIVANREIVSVTMIARTPDNRAVRDRLDAILADCPRIIQSLTSIAVLPA